MGVEKISYDSTAKVYSAEISPSAVDLVLNLKWVKKIDIQREKAAIDWSFASEGSINKTSAPAKAAPFLPVIFTISALILARRQGK